MDSINFINKWPSTILDLIFQHLTGGEVLLATQVHPQWNDFISTNSLTCWKQINVVLENEEDIMTLMSNSLRRYQSLKAVNVSRLEDLIKIIDQPCRNWKKISIVRTSFDSQAQLESILKASCRTLESLVLNNLSCRTEAFDEEKSLKLSFPRLRFLCIAYHDSDNSTLWLNAMISNTPKLDFIFLLNACDEHIKNLILNSSCLTKLTIYGKFRDRNFFKDLSMMLPARIEEFEFNNILSSSSEDENLRFFNHFFKSQSKSLRMFKTDALLELEEFETAFKMPRLHTLNVKSFHFINRESIMDYLENLQVPAEQERANLKVFFCHLMEQNLLQLLSIRAAGLEELRCIEFTANDLSDHSWFPKLKTFTANAMPLELVESIRVKDENERSNLEKLILERVGNEALMYTEADTEETLVMRII